MLGDDRFNPMDELNIRGGDMDTDFELEVFSPESVSPPPVSTPTACDPGLWVPPSWTSTLTRRRSRKFLYTKHDVILIAHM